MLVFISHDSRGISSNPFSVSGCNKSDPEPTFYTHIHTHTHSFRKTDEGIVFDLNFFWIYCADRYRNVLQILNP